VYEGFGGGAQGVKSTGEARPPRPLPSTWQKAKAYEFVGVFQCDVLCHSVVLAQWKSRHGQAGDLAGMRYHAALGHPYPQGRASEGAQ